MPDMDGFKLLEDVGLEMDLPIVMRGYLIPKMRYSTRFLSLPMERPCTHAPKCAKDTTVRPVILLENEKRISTTREHHSSFTAMYQTLTISEGISNTTPKDSKNVVMKGVTHGGCDYFVKPVRIETLRNIWQHVVWKRKDVWKDFEQSDIIEDGE
ncbi:two-component response regulator-like APRR9 [Rhododendron vialii]|uniref:two-component response regulator-like APRR9 n=1 Tax=Rhododendron vialii TaxID=182163 RepID=UPI00265DD025|nr:two-component response regulator-like APRR9 [Rhododendron vialii]